MALGIRECIKGERIVASGATIWSGIPTTCLMTIRGAEILSLNKNQTRKQANKEKIDLHLYINNISKMGKLNECNEIIANGQSLFYFIVLNQVKSNQ